VLLQYGANISEVNEQGQTPAELASASKKVSAARLLAEPVLPNTLMQPTGQNRPAAD
jgi:ankyrin repeat protein